MAVDVPPRNTSEMVSAASEEVNHIDLRAIRYISTQLLYR